jgi:hypothetical protein
MTRMVLLAAVLAATAADASADEPKCDSKAENKLIGTWKLVSGKYGGKEFQYPQVRLCSSTSRRRSSCG